MLFVLLMYWLYRVLGSYIDSEINLFFGAILIGIYAKFVYDFIDIYMDTIVLTSRGIHIISITWFMKFKVDFFERKWLESITYTKNGMWDILFNQGDVLLTLSQWNDFIIENIAQPKRQIGILTVIAKRPIAQIIKPSPAPIALALIYFFITSTSIRI